MSALCTDRVQSLVRAQISVSYGMPLYAGYFFFYGIEGLMRWCVCSLYNATVLCTLRPSVVRHTCDNIYIENLMLVWSVGIWIWTPPTCKLVTAVPHPQEIL